MHHPKPPRAPEPRALSKAIRAMRKRLGLNQTELGKLLGVGQRAISNWELGRGLAAIRVGILLAQLLEEHSDGDKTLQGIREMNEQLDAALAKHRPSAR